RCPAAATTTRAIARRRSNILTWCSSGARPRRAPVGSRPPRPTGAGDALESSFLSMTAFSPGRVGLVALCALVACARRTPIPVAPDQPVVSDSDSAILEATHPLDWPVSDSVVGPPRRLEP